MPETSLIANRPDHPELMPPPRVKKPHIDPHIRQAMLELELVVVAETERLRSYYMKKPGTGIYRVLLTFTPEGVCIQGDLTPEHNGTISSMGYGLEWFADQKGGEYYDSYLCSKFLRKRWVSECALESLTDPHSCYRDEATPEQIAGLHDICMLLAAHDIHEYEFYTQMCDLGFDGSELPGYDYDPQEACVLFAIQQRFQELWRERLQRQNDEQEAAAAAD